MFPFCINVIGFLSFWLTMISVWKKNTYGEEQTLSLIAANHNVFKSNKVHVELPPCDPNVQNENFRKNMGRIGFGFKCHVCEVFAVRNVTCSRFFFLYLFYLPPLRIRIFSLSVYVRIVVLFRWCLMHFIIRMGRVQRFNRVQGVNTEWYYALSRSSFFEFVQSTKTSFCILISIRIFF